MEYEPNLDDLCQDVATCLDQDPRYFDQDEGAFDWCGLRVFFRKLPDSFVLEVDGVTVECDRPF